MFHQKNSRSGAKIQTSVFICRRDGLTIRGTAYRPEGKNLPIAIVCHGFMAWQDSVRHYAMLLAQMGYAAYCFDFCGGSVMKGKSDGRTTEMSVMTEVRDLEAVMGFVRAQPDVDAERILLMGCSQGGLVAALTAAKNVYPVEKLCLFYPALCIPDDARAGKMMMLRFDPQNIPETMYCGPMKLGRCYPQDVMEMDPFEAIRSYRGRVCIVHGTQDKIVDLSYSQRAVQAYLSTKPEGMTDEERVSLHVIEGGAHTFTRKHDSIAMAHLQKFAAQ
ncbi:MAG: alpha/beta hydrolase [Clostridia bacterium]|nr:alpha/beta hydrolase [Clostridia bacterium]